MSRSLLLTTAAISLLAALLPAQLDWRVTRNISSTSSARLVWDDVTGRILRFEQFTRLFELTGDRWVGQPFANAPELERGERQIAIDSSSGALLLYLSDPLNPQLTNELWSWDGAGWQMLGLAPTKFQIGFRFIHDPVRGTTVALGKVGFSDTSLTTWIWNGTTWTQVAGLAPPARTHFGATFDPATSQVLIFGGITTNGGRLADTWAFDGTAWTDVTPLGGPTPRSRAALVAAPGGSTIMLGGSDGSGPIGDMWTWTGSQWTAIPTPLPPALAVNPAYSIIAAFDPVQNLVFAQNTTSTHQWDGVAWAETTGDVVPHDIQPSDTAWDPNLGRIVCMGRDQMWSYDGGRWFAEAAPLASPREYHRLATDTTRGKVMLYGGSWGTFYPTDTLEWDGTQWTSIPTAANPGTRQRHEMCFDPAHGQIVLFGGYSVGGIAADTWLYDGINWTQANPATVPPARVSHGMAYDEARSRVVMFGGGPGGAALNDTWEWDGADWIQLFPATFPDVLHGRALAWDPLRQRVMLYGVSASTYADETWEWDGVNWRFVPTDNAPCRNYRMPLDYDYGRQVLVGFGGLGGECSADWNGVWELFYDGVAAFTPYGAGCAGTVGTASLSAVGNSRPIVGQTFSLELAGIPSTQPAVGHVGVSDAAFAGMALPIDLNFLGMTGCWFWSSVDISVALPAPGAPRAWQIPLPNQPGLIGSSYYLQCFALDPGANALGVIASNGGAVNIGGL